MKPTRKILGFIRKSYVSNILTEKFIDEIMNTKGTMSRSQIIRDAVFEYRKSLSNKSSYDSPRMRLKQKELEKKIIEESITPEMFAESIQAPVTLSPTGTKYAMVGAWGNARRAIVLENIKEVFDDNPDLMGYHKSYIADHGPIPDEFVDDVFPRS